MTRPQFQRRAEQPMQPSSYRAAARRLRQMADALEARAEPTTPREKAALTSTLHTLEMYVRRLVARHHGRPTGDV